MINQSEKDTGPAVQGAAAESQFAPFGFAASRGRSFAAFTADDWTRFFSGILVKLVGL